MADSRQELQWVLLAQAGDKEALNELFKSIEQALYGYILRLVSGNTALAEDVLQDVFVLIYRKLGWLREAELFRAWMYRIASRETFKRLRKERPWSDVSVDETVLETFVAPALEEDFEPELIAALPELLEEISPTSRAVIALHYFEELSLKEVAEVLSLPLGTVKSRLAYGLQCLRRGLQQNVRNRRT